MSGDDALSICISSTWFCEISGLGNISAINADSAIVSSRVRSFALSARSTMPRPETQTNGRDT